MAASITPSDFAVYVVPPAGATNSRFLDRCVEDLSPSKIAECEKKICQWNTISIISVVAFFALAIGGFIAASLLAPVWVPPVVAIGSLLLAIPATSKIKEFHQRAESAKGEWDKYIKIQHYFADLTVQTSESIQNILRQQGISTSGQENLGQLKPLLAQAKFIEKQTDHWIAERDNWAKDQREIPATSENYEERKRQCQAHVIICQDQALYFKMQNAFINAVLRNPEFKGTFETLGAFSKLEVNKSEVKVPQEIFTFKNRNITPISYEDAKTQSVAELGQRIFAAMAA